MTESYEKYRNAIENLREPVANPRVVYQGEPGAYSEMAAIDFFGKDIEPKGLYMFEDTFKALRNGEADYAVLPIENSSTGAIRQVYDLMVKYECYLVGETTVPINHSFMVLPGANVDEITTVYSHEQGLFQCEEFLNAHRNWKQVAQPDTAGSAKMVAKLGNPHIAAICSSRAAKIYGLEIVEECVNYSSVNTTRFVVVSPQMELREGRDKICISLNALHKAGSLYDVLSIFKVHELNLVKLESRPIAHSKWEYTFFIEFNGELGNPILDWVIEALAKAGSDLRVFGNFKSNLE